MTLTTNGKNYIAQKFGVSNCYVRTGLNWTYLGTDNVIYTDSGGTSMIVSALVMSSIIQSVTFNGVTYTYLQLKTANDNTDVTLDDTKWIANNDGVGGTQYCYTAPPPPTGITVSNFSVTDNGDGRAKFIWTQDVAGNVTIGIQNGTSNTVSGSAGTNTVIMSVSLTSGTYTMCVTGNNQICASVTITAPPTGQKYNCVNQTCVADVNGIYPDLTTCQNSCAVTQPPKCIPKPDEIYIPDVGCVKKAYVVYGGAAFILLMFIR